MSAIRRALDGRWGEVRQQARTDLGHERFGYPTQELDLAAYRERVRDQLIDLASLPHAGLGFSAERGFGGDPGACVTAFEMLGHADLSLLVKAGVQFGLFGGAVANLGTARHHTAYLRDIVEARLPGCFAMTETGHGSDVQSLLTTATYDRETDEIVVHSPDERARRTTSAMPPPTARWPLSSPSWSSTAPHTGCTASSCRSVTDWAPRCPASRSATAEPRPACPVSTTAGSCSTRCASRGRTCSTAMARSMTTGPTPPRSTTPRGASSRCSAPWCEGA
ncbi:MAG: hypothetical protein LWW86_00785 [Micrococcales bacterium]|nr:hypothetical protein [Micrococcales bacterium]